MTLKVMTFNLRVPVKGDGINYFPNRRERILACIKQEDPDLIGFQEATDEVREFLRETLGDRYVVLGCGRLQGYRGESAPIAYRKNSFELVNLSTRFLSDTPTLPNTRYENSDQSKYPRMFLHAELSPNGMDRTIHLLNTHLDHLGKDARLLGMRQVLSFAENLSGPIILTGDMNARPNEACITLAKEWGLRDTAEHVTHTFHGFGEYQENFRIDYVFTNTAVMESHRVEYLPIDGVYVSDHYPVTAMLEI